MRFIFTEVIFAGVGWICLHVWHRDRKKVKEIKDTAYAGRYSVAGRIMILNLIAGVGAIAMFGLVAVALAIFVYRLVAS